MTRAVLALLAGLLVLAPGELAHFVFVQHVVCAEHGELVHEDGGAHAESELEGSARGQGPALHASAIGHGHEHCAFAATPREALTLPPANDVVAISAATRSEQLCSSTADAAVSEARFRLAPKTSPPA